jgi:arsenate reductase-like glutaredoxin family protein
MRSPRLVERSQMSTLTLLSQWIQTMAKHPILVKGEKAVIGRPPENLTKLL